MHVVAIFGTSPSDGSRAPALAAVLGGAAFDARDRVMSEGPCVVGVFHEVAEARALAERLKAAGFPTLVRDADAIERARLWSPVRSFTLHPERIDVTPHGAAPPYSVPWASVHLVVRGTGIGVDTTVDMVTEKKFSVGRAVATGGLLYNKSVKTEVTSAHQTREGFLHVYATGAPVSVFGETSVNYSGLGERLQPARTANFVTTLGIIRASAPSATYDDRLLTRVGQSVLLGHQLDPTRHVRLASALMAAAAQAGRARRG